MSYMFYEASEFNKDISNWNTASVLCSNTVSLHDGFDDGRGRESVKVCGFPLCPSQVKDMLAMFKGASAFDQDISDWDISSVR